MRLEDLKGRVFGKLTVVGFSHRNKKNYYWNCICECGGTATIQVGSLKRGETKSCGCIHDFKTKERFTKHGLSGTSSYNTWASMIQRCTNNNSDCYENYGGRGITVCDKWLTFEGFYEDMGDRPNEKTLDRKNVNGNYFKDNCKWATEKEQCNNMRNNVNITYNNKTQTLSQWSVELGIHRGTLNNRLFRSGWPIEKAFQTKVKGGNDE